MALGIQTAVGVLKAVAEPTRLRILALLAAGELNVKDMTRILGQSQPRISRHLKLLAEAGLVERSPEGSWVYFRLAQDGEGAELARRIVEGLDLTDVTLLRDRRRADGLRQEHEAAAQAYFHEHAGEWDRIRALHLSEEKVEASVAQMLGMGPFDLFVDLGTGTGRMLQLFSQRFRRGLGLDRSPAMLAYARAKLETAHLSNCQVRQADIYDLPLADQTADAVMMHQVLHFLADPQRALKEAARVLAPGGRMLIVDFAPHNLDFLRDQFAHERLGFADGQMRAWLADCGLNLLETRNLAPEGAGAGDKLTVSVWLAGRPGERPHPRTTADSRNLERVP